LGMKVSREIMEGGGKGEKFADRGARADKAKMGRSA